MKIRHLAIPLAIFLFVYSFTSCTKTTNKTNTIYDTAVVIKRDTVIKKDTVTKVDTIGSPKNPIIGQWTGTYTIDGNVAFGAFYFVWSIFPDHTIIERGGGPNGVTWTAQGTWTLAADSTITVDVVSTDPSEGGVVEHDTAKYSSSKGTMSNGKVTYTYKSETHSFTLNRVGDQ